MQPPPFFVSPHIVLVSVLLCLPLFALSTCVHANVFQGIAGQSHAPNSELVNFTATVTMRNKKP
jgi:hypothetical protein